MLKDNRRFRATTGGEHHAAGGVRSMDRVSRTHGSACPPLVLLRLLSRLRTHLQPDNNSWDLDWVMIGYRTDSISASCTAGPQRCGALINEPVKVPGSYGAIQFVVIKLFITSSHVPFFIVITSRYRKFMGSITEMVISESNSNSPNNTG
jgi:hypothetical protein